MWPHLGTISVSGDCSSGPLQRSFQRLQKAPPGHFAFHCLWWLLVTLDPQSHQVHSQVSLACHMMLAFMSSVPRSWLPCTSVLPASPAGHRPAPSLFPCGSVTAKGRAGLPTQVLLEAGVSVSPREGV